MSRSPRSLCLFRWRSSLPPSFFAVERWRRHNGAAVRRWLTATGEIEALCSLASHAFEHPGDPFPEFTAEAPWLEAEGIGHPLIPEERVVRNDVRIGGALRVLVVSGSNMSGKSTLLRAIGLNTVLANAGAPVCAKSFRLPPVSLHTSIRVEDSLDRGFADARPSAPYFTALVVSSCNAMESGTAARADSRIAGFAWPAYAGRRSGLYPRILSISAPPRCGSRCGSRAAASSSRSWS